MATEKQKTAIINMSRALGMPFRKINTDLSISEASAKISELKGIIENNILLCGYINPSNLYEMTDEEDADYGSAMGIDW